MNNLSVRQETCSILSYLNNTVGGLWSQDLQFVRASEDPLVEVANLNRYMSVKLSFLQVDTTFVRNCLACNARNPDHWLRDFANVIAPMIVTHAQTWFQEDHGPMRTNPFEDLRAVLSLA